MLDVLKALADPCRLRLVAVLLRGEFTVQELTAIMGVGQSKVSWHLKILVDAGVLAVKRQGTWSYYSVGGGAAFFRSILPAVEQALASLPERERDLAAVAGVLDERRRRSQEFFDRHARQWDDLARTLLPVPDYRERLLEMVPGGGLLAEIGIGTGGLLSALAAKCSGVIGVDHSPAMLEEARRRLAQAGIAGMDLRLGEMAHLPISDGSVDCVLLNMVLHHAAAPAEVLSGIRRVLAPGGTLLLADLARHERESAREQLADQWLGFSEEELAGWLAAAGFTAISCERIEGAGGEEAVLLVQGTTPQPPPQRGGGVFIPMTNSHPLVREGENDSPPGSGGGGGGHLAGDSRIHNRPDLKHLRKSLRNESTPAERKLWSALKQSQLGGYKFSRQHSVGRYIVDFYCASARLAVELDGESHFTEEAKEYDEERTAFLNTLNIKVIRFLNTDVQENLDAVRGKILEVLTTPQPPPEPGGGN